MREIKFRAWDKEAKRFYNAIPQLEFDILEGRAYERHPFKEVTDQYIFMQYTGLKDKNGIKIYEGDIVNFYEPHEPVMVGKMIFNTERAGFEFDQLHDEYSGKLYASDSKYFEVIGNIYQNKELLE